MTPAVSSGPQGSAPEGPGHDAELPHGVEHRPYQFAVIKRLRSVVAGGRKRVLLVAPTGSGKTVIAAAIVKAALDRGKRVLILVHLRELVQQTARKLFEQGIDAGIIQAGSPTRPDQPVQVASIQTLHARAFHSTRMPKPVADLIIVDEAHHVPAPSWTRILDSYPDAIVIGMTATPCRSDGRGLGGAFEALVECPQIEELIELGFLVRTKVYAPSTPDLKGVRVKRGDYVETELAARMDRPKLVGDIVEHHLRLAVGRKTVVFASSVAHSKHIAEEFGRVGVRAEHIDGNTPIEERDAILARLSRGDIEVVCNYGVLTEGWDQPDVSCIVLARPTKSVVLYRQMIGRVLRPAPGKIDALVLDHAGLTWEHGLVEEPVVWTLDPDRRAENRKQTERREGQAPTLEVCPECSAIRTGGQPCPACGWRPQRRPQAVEVAEGDLTLVGGSGSGGPTEAEREQVLGELESIRLERGYKPGWVARTYKKKHGVYPRSRHVTPKPPSAATRAWVRHCDIRYAKAQQR